MLLLHGGFGIGVNLRNLLRRNSAAPSSIRVVDVLDEVAAISSDVDRYGMGSMRRVILGYGKRLS